ncbi:MAG: hypothetical protein FJ267_08140, partial [Planctomycetes bacterium]|nr:hypothetical protein [Planctomycetota bacterium]
MFQVLAMLACLLGGVCVGYFLGALQGRYKQESKSKNEQPTSDISSKPETKTDKLEDVEAVQFQSMLQALQDVTNQVDQQVHQHSSRLNEASLLLENPTESQEEIVLGAASMLLAANEQLQSELEDA